VTAFRGTLSAGSPALADDYRRLAIEICGDHKIDPAMVARIEVDDAYATFTLVDGGVIRHAHAA
jgi:hypothetical protein